MQFPKENHCFTSFRTEIKGIKVYQQNCNLEMYKDFIVKQTSDYPSEFKAKTLVGNWYEERCNPQRTDNFHFYKERKDLNEAHKPVLTEDKFQQSTSNWLNFQNYDPKKTFQTQYKDNYLKSEEQKRHSVLNPFITKKSEFDKNKDALDEYREKWTKSGHVYDHSRTSIGHAKK